AREHRDGLDLAGADGPFGRMRHMRWISGNGGAENRVALPHATKLGAAAGVFKPWGDRGHRPPRAQRIRCSRLQLAAALRPRRSTRTGSTGSRLAGNVHGGLAMNMPLP